MGAEQSRILTIGPWQKPGETRSMRKANTDQRENRRPTVRRVFIGGSLAIVMLVFALLSGPLYGNAESDSRWIAEPPIEGAEQGLSRFRHDTPQHVRMPCLVCHIRSEGRTTPRMPGHIPCSSCHSDQFARGNASPMCTICHTPTDVKPFPPLRSFNMVFDHGRHLRLTDCATCHKPSARGVALSIPSRANGHRTCFQCHGPQTMVGGRNIGSCSTCHKPGRLVRTSEAAAAFSRGFSHAEHSVRKLSCNECHTVRAGVRRGLQVSSPAAAMHFPRRGASTCATCHNGRRAFGAEDFANCRKCHKGNSFGF